MSFEVFMDRFWVLICLGALAACGGEVVVESDGLGPDAEGQPGTGSTPGCNLCGVQACGMCQYEGGDYAFACANGARPPAEAGCLETGSVHAEGDIFYECWRCFYD